MPFSSKSVCELWSIKTVFELNCRTSDFEATTAAVAVSDASEENFVEDDED
jgi:hypothetical protein